MKLERRTVRYETLQDLVNEARQLAERGYSRAGEWSLGQVCNHLAGAINMSRDGFPSGLPRPMRPIMRLVLFGRMRKRIPIRLRVPTLPSLQPPADIADEEAIDRLSAAIARFNEPGATFAASPVLGKLTAEEWNVFHLWHSEHHMSFLLPSDVAATV